MSNAFWAYGSQLKMADDGTSVLYTKIAEVRDISGPNMSKNVIEVTSQDSPSGYKEFISGMKDGGEISVSANWLPNNSTHDGSVGLLAQFNSDKVKNWQLITPSDGTAGSFQINFKGFVTAYNIDLPMEDKASLELTIKVTNKPTFV